MRQGSIEFEDGRRQQNQANLENEDSLTVRLLRKFTPEVKAINQAKRAREEYLGRARLTDLRENYEKQNQ